MFKVAPQVSCSTLYYNYDDRSILYEPVSILKTGLNISINYIQLDLSKNGFVVGLGGYCPHEKWQIKKLTKPRTVNIQIYYGDMEKLQFGSVPSLNESSFWKTYYDPTSEIICLDSGAEPSCSVEILPKVILSLDGKGKPVNLWCFLDNNEAIK
jgi:hypothetical protein